MKIKNLIKNEIFRFSQFRDFEWRKRGRSIKRYNKKYDAQPDFLNIEKKDPFDYTLRSKEEVMKDFKEKGMKYTVSYSAPAYKVPKKDL